ncbi:hypothetical protein [Paracoccus everestensis]|uniref:hypothetical protein n=1 Tax=Paracoccus everestensis TaxID=2903900 RepID=UPI001F480BDA|nr:hypothetical protein [Paracoccus everestensis]
MSYASIVVPTFFGFVAGGLAIRHFEKREIKAARHDNFTDFRERLGFYAQMKTPCATIYHPASSNTNFVPSGFMLNEDQHDILLGILKKIEAKSAMVAVVLVLAFDLMATNLPKEFKMAATIFWGVANGLLISMLLASMDAAPHLGQRHFRKMPIRPEIAGRELQLVW